MKAVKINKTDTCLTYVLKRTGQFKKSLFGSGKYSLESVHELFDEQKIESIDDLKVGDIILWSSKMYWESYPTEITSEGFIISNDVQRNIHVGVIEKINDGMVLFSECSRTKMENGGIPILGLRDLTNTRLPDFILTPKN